MKVQETELNEKRKRIQLRTVRKGPKKEELANRDED